MNKKIIVLGANGMLGGSIFRYLTTNTEFEVLGTVRQDSIKKKIALMGFDNVISGIDVSPCNIGELKKLLESFKPTVVINCVGVIKQLDAARDYENSIEINSLLPHRLATLCTSIDARLVHFSTDCVFTGRQGNYYESDQPDSRDLYGLSKLLGEVFYDNHLTIRTSIIGHELNRSVSLVDWFLNQKGTVKGYSKAIFSGLPTVHIAEFLSNYILNSNICGLYHLSVEPIDKYSLLNLVKSIYKHDVEIIECDEVQVNRSLNSDNIREETGYIPPTWSQLIGLMHNEYTEYFR